MCILCTNALGDMLIACFEKSRDVKGITARSKGQKELKIEKKSSR